MVAERQLAKARKVRQPRGKLEEQLNDDAILKSMSAGERAERKRRVKKEKKNLRRIVPCFPDSPWFSANWDNGESFPPGGDTTLMGVCRGCGRYTPPQCISSRDYCLECQHDHMTPGMLNGLPSSGSSINLAMPKSSLKTGKPYHGGF